MGRRVGSRRTTRRLSDVDGQAILMNAPQILRTVYAVCLVGATCVHVGTHIQYGVLLGTLEGYGYPVVTRYFWSSLTLLDPLAALLMFIRPRAGVSLAGVIIVSDVAHNSWILHHFGRAPDAAYWAQVAFLAFLLGTGKIAWQSSHPGQSGS
jgi:hypothetical protein